MEKRLSKFVNATLSSFEKHYYIYMIIILIIAMFDLFFNLGANPVQDWDEARHGVSAYEMIKSNNYLVPTYDNNIDYWNAKPPLGLWFIVLAYKIFGYNAFALRFFSALSALLCLLIVAIVTKKRLGKPASILSSLVLITTVRFVLAHSARSGDFDSMLTLFILLGVLCAVKLSENIKYFYLSGIFFAIAFLLKSYAALQLLAIIILYLIFTKKYKTIKLGQYVMFAVSCLIPVLVWGVLRYQHDGFKFITTMITFDVFDRCFKAIEGHGMPLGFYLDIMLQGNTIWLFYLFGCVCAYMASNGIKIKGSQNADFKFMVILWAIVPFILFSLAISKLHWYINPIYPALAILTGWVMYSILKSGTYSTIFKALLVVFIIHGFLYSQTEIGKGIYNVGMPEQQAVINQLNNIGNFKGNDIYSAEWSQSNFFTAKVLSELNPKTIKTESEFLGKNPKDLLLVQKDDKDLAFIKESKLNIIVQTEKWAIVQK